MSVLVWENHWKSIVGAGPADPEVVKRGRAEFAQVAQILNGQLEGRTWVCGEGVTLADFALASPLMYQEKGKLPLEDYPSLMQWFARVRQLPCWAQTHIDL